MKENGLLESEVTLLDLIDITSDFFKYLVSKWYWYVLMAVMGLGLVFYKVTTFKPHYTGEIEFVIEAQDGVNDIAGGVLGQLGLGGRSGINSNRVIKIAKSKAILRDVLVRSVVLEQDTVQMMDFVLDSSNLAFLLEENEQLSAVTIDSVQQITDASDRNVNLLVDFIYRHLNGEGLPKLLVNYDEDSEIFSVGVSSWNELLSYELAKAFFEEIETFYTDKFNSSQVDYYHSLKNRVDSIYIEQQKAQYRLLKLKDQSDGLYLQADRAQELRLQQEVSRLSGVYSELFRNLNQAEFSIRNLQPVVVVIDQPVLPLEKSQFNLFIQLVLYVVGAVFLLTGIFFVMFLWNIMKNMASING